MPSWKVFHGAAEGNRDPYVAEVSPSGVRTCPWSRLSPTDAGKGETALRSVPSLGFARLIRWVGKVLVVVRWWVIGFPFAFYIRMSSVQS